MMSQTLVLALTIFKTASSIANPSNTTTDIPMDILTKISTPPSTTLVSIEQASISGSDISVAPPSASTDSLATPIVLSVVKLSETYVSASISIYLSTMVIPATPSPSFITMTKISSENGASIIPLDPLTITDVSTVFATNDISSPSASVFENFAVSIPTASTAIPTALDDTLPTSPSQPFITSQAPDPTLPNNTSSLTSMPDLTALDNILLTLFSQLSSTSLLQNSTLLYSEPLETSTPIPTALDDTLTSTLIPQSLTVLDTQTSPALSPIPTALDDALPSPLTTPSPTSQPQTSTLTDNQPSLTPDSSPTSNPFSPSISPSPKPPTSLPTSLDGTCSEKTFSCYGSAFGECCSLGDTCGSDETHCGEMKCKLGLGNCGSESITVKNRRVGRGRRRGGRWTVEWRRVVARSRMSIGGIFGWITSHMI